MQDVRIGVGIDETVYGEHDQLVIRWGGFKRMPDVNSILIVGVKDDPGEVVMFVKDHACDSEGFIIEDVVGLGLIGDVELESEVELREPVGHTIYTGICEADHCVRGVQCRVPGDALQEKDAVGIASMLGEPHQLVSDCIVDADRCHQAGFVGHLGIDGRQHRLEEWEDCQGPVDVARK